jgi:hypothetical protein
MSLNVPARAFSNRHATSGAHSSLNPRANSWQPPRRYSNTHYGQHIHCNMPMLGPNGFLHHYSRPQQFVPHRLVLSDHPVTALIPCRTPGCMQLTSKCISDGAGLQQTFAACSAGSASILLPLLPLISVRWSSWLSLQA